MKIIELHDIMEFLRKPIALFMLGLMACIAAFNIGLQYARHNVEVHSITHNLAFIEIAGEEHMYELDWSEPEPISWQ